MVKVLSSDILIADIIVPAESVPQLVEEFHLKPGEKTALTREQADRFRHAIKGVPLKIMPGGSSANTLTTLGKMMGDKVDTTFLGVTGGGEYSGMIRDELKEAGVRLLPDPKELSKDKLPESAISYVVTFPGGERAIATYPGNAKELLKEDVITDDMVRKSDVLLLQGSLLQKLDAGFANKLLQKRWEFDKELWLTLPTQAKFGEEKAGHFRWLITSADVVMSNQEELMRIYETKDPAIAIQHLQKAFLEHPVKEREGKSRRREPVGFITNGSEGAMIVTAHHIEKIPAASIKPDEIVNTLGAGDTSFAGFMAGHLMNLPYNSSAQIGMTLAAEKLKVNGPRLADPMAALKEASPYLAAALRSKIQSAAKDRSNNAERGSGNIRA